MSVPQKLCPRCGGRADLAAQFCGACGHQFRTQFTGTPDRTQVFVPAPPQAVQSPHPAPPVRRGNPWMSAMVAMIALAIVAACALAFSAAVKRQAGAPPPPPGAGGGSVVGSGPFQEVETRQEKPEIRVLDRTGQPHNSHLIFIADGPAVVAGRETYDLAMVPPESSIQIPPGTYRYELHGPRYERTGEIDQYGTLTCRRFRRYDLTLVITPADMHDSHQDLGDQ